MKTLIPALLTAFLTLPAFAQIRERRPIVPPPPPPNPVRVENTDIDLTIEDGSARLDIRQTLLNPSGAVQEAWLHLPLPKGARASDAALRIGEEWVEAELLDADDARGAYEEIVRRRIDPALIEYIDEGLLRARVFPVPAHGKREVELSLHLLLPEEFDAWSLRLPLKALAKDGRVTLNGRVDSRRELLQPYSPTHRLDVDLERAGRARLAWSGDAREDMHLIFPMRPEGLSAIAVSSRPAGEDGFVMLRITPGSDFERGRSLPRDLILTVDTSGSMRGEKLRQAQAALRAVLETLNDGDRFAILAYSADVWPLTEGLVGNTRRNREAALDAIEELRADGGTNIEAALAQSLALCEDGEHTPYLLFLTDGLPSVGEQDVGKLLGSLRRRGDSLPRIYAFGVGNDVNTALLDGIADAGRAIARYVLPGEDLESSLSRLAAQIREPLWTDLELDSDGVLRDLEPSRLGDLFAGQSVVVLARYRQDGERRITLRGRQGGRRVSRDFEVELEDGYGHARYLPRLWAATRVNELERRLRENPHDDRARSELLELATRYGMVTSQTSLLAREDDEQFAQALRRNDWEDARARMMAPRAPEPQLVGDAAVRRASELSKGQMAETLEEREGYAVDSMALNTMSSRAERKRIGGRIFQRAKDGEWEDLAATGAKARLSIAPWSEAWFELARLRPDLREMLGDGQEIRITLGQEVLSVAPDGKSKLSAEDRAWLATARL